MPTESSHSVGAYHLHVYYDVDSTRELAAWVRDRLVEHFPSATYGRWHDKPVGPHPKSMYQVAFAPELLATILPWLMLNRQGLDILLHPETGYQRADHSDDAAWLGRVLPLDLSKLPPD